VAFSFICGGNRRKLPTCRKSLTRKLLNQVVEVEVEVAIITWLTVIDYLCDK
jgi:hypothetical protein